MGGSGNCHRAEFIAAAVAKAYDRELVWYCDMQFLQFTDQLACSFLIEADHSSTIRQLGLDKRKKQAVVDRICRAAALGAVVPEKAAVIKGEQMIAQRAKTAKVTVVSH